ncbi:glycosyltransferase [soil metagenome]
MVPTPTYVQTPSPGAPTSHAKVFFATIAAGGGHVATAQAMAAAVQLHRPGLVTTAVSDYMQEVGRRVAAVERFDRQHKEMWKRALRFPLSARLGQRLIDALPQLTIQTQRRFLARFAEAAAADLTSRRPGLVVSNHGLVTTGLALAQRDYGLTIPVLTFATETHNISAYWADPSADHVLVPNGGVLADLQRMGVPPEKMTVVGYPVQQAFLQAPTQEAARAHLGLADRFTVLVSLGGEGIGGDPLATVRALGAARPQAQIVVMCGRNEALKRRVETLGAANLRVESFSSEMAVFLAASDVVVGKAGPASVYETLAVGRPLLVTSYAGLNEKGVTQFVGEQGLGRYVPTTAALLAGVAFYAVPERAREVAERCRKLDLKGQTNAVAQAILSYLDHVSDPLETPHKAQVS